MICFLHTRYDKLEVLFYVGISASRIIQSARLIFVSHVSK